MDLSAARMKLLLPTFALPMTYTSRPFRSANIAITDLSIPSPFLLDTHSMPARVSLRLTSTSCLAHSFKSSKSVPLGSKSHFVSTSKIGLPPTTSRTLLRKDP